MQNDKLTPGHKTVVIRAFGEYHTDKQKEKNMKFLMNALILALVVLLVPGCGKKSTAGKEEAAAKASATAASPAGSAAVPAKEDLSVISHSMWASTRRQNMDLLRQNINDQEAVKKMYSMQAIFILKEGMTGNIVSRDNGLVEIRPQGKDFTVWTFAEAVGNPAPQAAGEEIYVTVKGAWAGPNANNMAVLRSVMNDPEGIKKMADMKAVMMLKEGTEVTIVSMENGLVAVRPVGKTYTLWMFSSGVRKK
jgi:hypothetical protein